MSLLGEGGASVGGYANALLKGPGVLLAVLRSKLGGNGEADAVMRYVLAEQSTHQSGNLPPKPLQGQCRLYGWDLSYFTGKVRGYLRYKARQFEEIVADPAVVVKDILVPATGSTLVPQVQLPDGRFVQDSTEIMDAVEKLWPAPLVLPPESCPKQRLLCHIVELLADEWLLVPAFHWRWAYSGDGSEAYRMPSFMGGVKPQPNHLQYNLEQWGAFLRPDGSREQQVRTAKFLFDHIFLGGFGGIKRSMVALGVTNATVAAWEASCRNILSLFEEHFRHHPFVLGYRPSTADFGLLGPVWAHLLTDPVPGAMMRQDFPRVSAWADRLHDGGQACEADPRPEGDWLAGDDVPKTMLPIVQVFFKEMWPVLESSCTLVTRYLQDKPADHRMPNKSFVPVSPDQLQQGSLTHDFCLPFNNQGLPGESRGRRMIVPYQLWMLQRLAKDLPLCGSSLQDLGAQQLLKLPELLRGCRLRKESRSWCRTGRTGLHLQPASSKLSCKTLFPHPSASLG